METTILIILAASIGFFHNANKETEYALNMEDGSKTHVILKKNGIYACPIYCEADHVHKAVLFTGDEVVDNHQFIYHISVLEKNDFPIYCSTKKILSMSKLKPRLGRDRIPDVVSTSQKDSK